MDNDKKGINLSANIIFPSQLDSFENKKSPEWGLRLAQAIQNEWFYGYNVTNQTVSRFYTQRNQLIERRMYAKGLQSMDKYKQIFKEDGDKSFLNLSSKPISIIPKLVDVVVNGMCDRGYSVKATAIDQASTNERIAYRRRIEDDQNAKDFIIAAKEKLGVDVGNLPIDQIPETKAELDLHMQLEYKQSIEMSEELAIDMVLKENRFEDTIDRQIKNDLTTCGVAWTKHRFCPDRGILLEYVNPENKIQSYSDDPFFRDCFYHGEFKVVPISEVLVEFQWLNEPGNEDKKAQLASSAVQWWDYHRIAQDQRIRGTTNLLYFTYKTTRDRVKKIIDADSGSKEIDNFETTGNKKKDFRKFKKATIAEEILFEGVLVLGTDIMLKWEVSQNMSRPKSNRQKVVDQYIGVAPGKERGYIDSLVARMIPVEDKLNVLELKAEQIIQKIMPDGFVIDPDAIAELDFGGGNKLTVQNMVDMFWQTGSIFARSFGANGDPMYSKPITELRTGDSLGKLQALRVEREGYMNLMRDVIGLNKASDASNPDKDTLVGIQKLASLNSNVATRHILDGAKYITKLLAEGICYRVADLLKYSDLKEDFARKIGATAVMDLDAIKDLHLYDFAIYIDLYLDIEEKAKLEADLSVEIQNGTLSFADKYRILSIPNFKYAIAYASVLRQKRIKEMQAQKIQEMQAQAQANAQSAQMAEQARQKTAVITGEEDRKTQEVVNQGLNDKERIKGQEQRLSLDKKLNGEFQIAQVQAGIQSEKIRFIEDKKDERLDKQSSHQSELNVERKKENPKAIDFQSKNFDNSIFELEA
ncbi:MAG TPA: hypothetical protein PLP39_08980 [Flavobacterium lutivivi]|nr:hypothetical protein [Flavobacterium lutivivi]